jgi:hypothetical protein
MQMKKSCLASFGARRNRCHASRVSSHWEHFVLRISSAEFQATRDTNPEGPVSHGHLFISGVIDVYCAALTPAMPLMNLEYPASSIYSALSTTSFTMFVIPPEVNGCNMCPLSFDHFFCLRWVHELEYIIEHEVATTLWHQLKCLRKVHWLLFFVNL